MGELSFYSLNTHRVEVAPDPEFRAFALHIYNGIVSARNTLLLAPSRAQIRTGWFKHTTSTLLDSQVHAVFWRETLKFGTRIIYTSLDPLPITFRFRQITRLLCVLGDLGLETIPMFPILKNQNQNQNPFVNRSPGAYSTRMKNIWGSSLKNGMNMWTLGE